jgi:hypothetical protein
MWFLNICILYGKNGYTSKVDRFSGLWDLLVLLVINSGAEERLNQNTETTYSSRTFVSTYSSVVQHSSSIRLRLILPLGPNIIDTISESK